jgi:hypothetical protein
MKNVDVYMKHSSRKLFLVLALFFVGGPVGADDVDRAAELIVTQPDKDSQCRTFFRYFKRYLEDQEYDKADSLTARVDAKKPGIVPYCDANQSRFW